MAAAGPLLPAEAEALVQALRGTELRDAGGQGCGGVRRGEEGVKIWGVSNLGGIGSLLRGWGGGPGGLRGVSLGCPLCGSVGFGVPRGSGRGVNRGCKCGVCPPQQF